VWPLTIHSNYWGQPSQYCYFNHRGVVPSKFGRGLRPSPRRRTLLKPRGHLIGWNQLLKELEMFKATCRLLAMSMANLWEQRPRFYYAVLEILWIFLRYFKFSWENQIWECWNTLKILENTAWKQRLRTTLEKCLRTAHVPKKVTSLRTLVLGAQNAPSLACHHFTHFC
jgi:hypothetical protein